MKHYKKYNSNTLAGTASQSWFESDGNVTKSIVLLKITNGGRYNYSLTYSNTIDSTFADGCHSRVNKVLDEWKIHSLKVGRCKECDMNSFSEIYDIKDMYFNGEKHKTVNPGEIFHTDETSIEFEKGEYIAIIMEFSGCQLPCHEEAQYPTFVMENGKYKPNKHTPVPVMTGCDRIATKKLGFFGDSITQGIGPTPNSYTHYVAVLSKKLSDEYSYWDIGIGFARASDAASDGAWALKAKSVDIITVCFGVNDILMNGAKAKDIVINALETIVKYLKAENIKVILQTVPPFDYNEEQTKVWNEINEYILNNMKEKVDLIFDVRPILSGDRPETAKFGGHPNEEGSELWGIALAKAMQTLL